MKLSILMITYNHEKYVAQALDSILMQVTDFSYEIVIGEDCSTDSTRTILRQYHERYPDRIRLILPEKNLGMMRNFVETYYACEGEYVAILDGDDYWTSPYKLQKQVDFLDSHPDFAICFHNASYLWEIEDRPSTLFCKEDQQEVTVFEDLLVDNFIPTLTCMFRNRLFGAFPDWIFGLKFGDWPLHVLNAQFGKIGYLNEPMAVYRVHSAGAVSGIHTDEAKMIEYIQGMIQFYQTMDKHFGHKYSHLIKKKVAMYYCSLAKAYEAMGEIVNAVKFYLLYILSSPLSDTTKRVAHRLGIS